MCKMILLVLVVISIAFSSDLLPFPFVYVKGEADTTVTPNNARIHFSVKGINVESTIANDSVEKISGEIINFFTSNGISSEDIKAYEISKEIIQDNDNDKMKILGYECSRRFEIYVKDLKIYGGISQRLLTMNNIAWLRVDFSRDDREKIDSILILEACRNARKNAVQLSGSLNAKVKSLYALSKSGFYTMPAQFGLAEEDHRRGSSTSMPPRDPFVPQKIDIQCSINTIFRLKE